LIDLNDAVVAGSTSKSPADPLPGAYQVGHPQISPQSSKETLQIPLGQIST
jgi:hypothetical protein